MEFDLSAPPYFQLLSAFALGFLSSFTPCVFPLIPITLSLFGIRDDLTRSRRFLLSSAYVAGICATYTALGLFAARSGAVFGAFLGNPWVVGMLIIFLLAVAAFTLDLFQIAALARVQTAASRIGGKGFLGAFMMGAASGVVAAPCIGPALVVILGIAASSQNTLWGGAMLLSYSLGLGVIFLAIGTFSGLLQALPRAGNWMFAVKFFMATALIMIALFLGQRYFQNNLLALNAATDLVLLLFLVILASLLAWVALINNRSLLKLLAAIMLAVPIYEVLFTTASNDNGADENKLIWLSSYDEVLAESKRTGKIAMIDLYADWCAACKEFEHITFADAGVKNALGEFVLGRIDFTDTSAPEPLKLTERYGIPGLPVILFLKPDETGDEIEQSRVTGFLNAPDFLQHLKKVSGQ